MSNDRYEELRAVRKESYAQVSLHRHETAVDFGEKPEMNIFYDKVSEIEDRIAKVNTLVGNVHKLHDKNLSSINNEKEKESAIEIDRQCMEINNEIKKIRAQLIDLDNSNVGTNLDSGDLAVRRGRYSALIKRFSETIEYYRSVERESQMKYKARIERQIRVINPNASDQEIKDAIDSGNVSNMFQQAGFVSERSYRSKKVLQQVEDRNLDISRIGKTINELNVLFSEMEDMVTKQQSMLDNIEHAVQSTEQYTVRANNEMDTAIVLRRSSRKVPTHIYFFIRFLPTNFLSFSLS
ncbi:Syntaxin-like protein psy1 [Smittium mucronatum]|uniref:Syntaxin-like protein psy1 n=1 Tax=Smittium mucronatum TaxID=133383 RepID=A0A1R0GY70_9FUNG|nr:Syntaxin-like protein psy1 [Smittium mucronatum]